MQQFVSKFSNAYKIGFINELTKQGWKVMKKQHILCTSLSDDGDILVVLWESKQFVYHFNSANEYRYQCIHDFMSVRKFTKSIMP